MAVALARARKATLAAAIPLAGIALSFVAPIDTGDRATPLDIGTGAAAGGVWVSLALWAPYISAFCLSLVLLGTAAANRARIARIRRRAARRAGIAPRDEGTSALLPNDKPAPVPDRAAQDRARWSLRIAAAGIPGFCGLLFLEGKDETGLTLIVGGLLVGAALCAALLVRRAAGVSGFRRLGFLVMAYAALTAPLTGVYVFAAVTAQVGWGAVVFLLCAAAVWALSAIAVWPARRPSRTPMSPS